MVCLVFKLCSQGGKHQEYEQKLIQQMIHKEIAAVQQEMKTKSQRYGLVICFFVRS